MGRLAKHGIIRGKSVPVEGLLKVAAPRTLDPYSRSCLACFGFARIAEKVIEGEDLSSDEIEVLITKASMTVLMKLVELKQYPDAPVRVDPIVALPLELWLDQGGPDRMCRQAVRQLTTISLPEVHAVIDFSDFSRIDSLWPEVMQEIRNCRPDLTLVGPSVERIVSWLSLHESAKNRSLRAYRLERILAQLKQLGFDRLRECSYRGSLRLMSSVGFLSDVLTRLDRFPTPSLYARELFKLNRVTQTHPVVDSWSPGVVLDRNRMLPRNAGLDLTVMRALAVGSITLNYIPKRRACGSYLSLSAIQLFSRLGATGPFFGAVNSETAASLALHPYEKLCRYVAQPASVGGAR